MDGASKFVRGDAIAGLLITFINVIGGIIIGIVQQGLTFAEAAQTYTLLTVGDGLVTQVPALIVSTAAGLLVSKAGVTGSADKALSSSSPAIPKALGMSAASWADGAPAGHPDAPVPGARRRRRLARLRRRPAQGARGDRRRRRSDAEAGEARPARRADLAALKIDDLKIELGYALLPLVNAPTAPTG